MKRGLLFLITGTALLVVALLFACAPVTPIPIPVSTPSGTAITGVVIGEDGLPISGVTVRVKTTARSALTSADGKFTLTGLEAGQPVKLTAWASGYYNGGGEEVLPGTRDVEIVLKKHTDSDNPGYPWTSAFTSAGEKENCENCHSTLTPGSSPTGRGESLPFDEWARDAHALSTQNPRFLSMYLGQDIDGNQSPPTRYGYSRDYGRFPLRPNLSQPYFGPGYKLDFPDTTGNCAACHAPAAAIHSAYGIDPTAVSGVGAQGVACDFCHKVWDVRLDQATNLPFPNMPGVLSFEFRRPPEGHQLFAGPFDDVAPGEDTYTPIQRQSQFCAPCHFGSFWDTQIYNSFGEWLESPYSDAERAITAGLSSSKTCQDCHMPHRGATYIALPDKGAAERDPQTIFSHRMPGAADETLLQNAVTMTVDASREGDKITVCVTIVNDQTGHHVPTDSPLRQMILLVSATDGQGQALPLQDGPTVPDWGGIGSPARGYYAGLPGQGYAKILMELWTEVTPSGAYWNPTRVVSDNRLPAFGSDTSTFVFTAPANRPARVLVRLLFRRAYIELMEQKRWDAPDIIMEQETVHLP